MPTIRFTWETLWAACSPILTLSIALATGAYLSRSKVVAAKDAKLMSTVLLNILYPCLLFTSIVVGVDLSNITSFVIMIVASAVIVGVALILGFLIMKLTNPPNDFRYGTIMATCMGNYGDLVIAVVQSIGNQPPFSNGDASKGVAYVAGFLCLSNLFFFTVGYKAISEDFKDYNQTLLAGSTEIRNEVDNSKIAEVPTETQAAADSRGSFVIIDSPSQEVPIQSLQETRKPLLSFQIPPTIKFWISTICNPCNIATTLGLIVALVPALRNLFYRDDPTQIAPLSFLFKSLTLIGNGGVPIGILNVGSALGRLEFKNFAPARIISAVAFCRLILLPAIGIAVVQTLANNGTIPNDKMMRFVLMLEASVPTASSAVYFTQYWHPLGVADNIASVMIVQYGLAFITMTLSLNVILSLLT